MRCCISVPKALLSLLFYSILVVHFQSHGTNEIVHYRRSSSSYWEEEVQDEPNSSHADSTEPRNHDVNANATLVPFFVGAGLGTTGTTALYNAMCLMGFPSVHFRRSCIHPVAVYSNQSSTMNTSNDIQEGNDSESSVWNRAETSTRPLQLMKSAVEKGVSAHRRLLQSWRSLRLCTRRSRQIRKQNHESVNDMNNVSRSNCENFTGIADNLFQHASQVVSSGLAFVTDTPYPFLVDFLWHVAVKHRPITGIILTERDPQAWVSSRLRHHVGEADLMCFHPDNAFDLQKCLEQSRHYPFETNDTFGTFSPNDRQFLMQNLTFQHSEITGGNYSATEKEQYRSLLLHSMEQYQTRIKRMMKGRVIVMNLWNEHLPTVPDIANALWERMEQILPADILRQYKSAAVSLQSVRR